MTHIHTVILYQTPKQCEFLQQQRFAEYVYNIADNFLLIELWLFGIFNYTVQNVVRKDYVVSN